MSIIANIQHRIALLSYLAASSFNVTQQGRRYIKLYTYLWFGAKHLKERVRQFTHTIVDCSTSERKKEIIL